MSKTAIFVDVEFFLKRFPTVYRDRDQSDPALVAKTLHEMALAHVAEREDSDKRDLLRIHAYDCPPLDKKAEWPQSRQPIDFSQTKEAIFRRQLYEHLNSKRKVDLWLGRRQDLQRWRLKPSTLKKVVDNPQKDAEFTVVLTDDDFEYDTLQKGVEMQICLDIAHVAYTKQVDQIVLVACDSDFVPAAKRARREGIDFILDPMRRAIPKDLREHVDGVHSTCPHPKLTMKKQADATPAAETNTSATAVSGLRLV